MMERLSQTMLVVLISNNSIKNFISYEKKVTCHSPKFIKQYNLFESRTDSRIESVLLEW